MQRFIIHSLLVLVALFAISCASSRSGNVYSRDQARVSQSVEDGTVVRVDRVQIEGTQSGVGGVAGGVAGGVVGSTIGSGRGSTLAAVGGALAGSVAGARAEEGMTRREGLEITVKLDEGPTIVVVQEADTTFAVGDQVRVIRGSDGTTRVRQ